MTNKINGIDVSESVLTATNNDVYYSQKAVDELQNNIKRLQEENERLNQELDIKEKMLDKFMIGSGETLEKLQKENEKLKADLKGETEQCQKWYQLETDKHFQMLKYEQALEEIRKEANRLLFVENPIYGYNNSNYFEILAKYVLAKTDEVLNDRD